MTICNQAGDAGHAIPAAKRETMQALHQLNALSLNFSAAPATLNELHDHHQSAMLSLMS